MEVLNPVPTPKPWVGSLIVAQTNTSPEPPNGSTWHSNTRRNQCWKKLVRENTYYGASKCNANVGYVYVWKHRNQCHNFEGQGLSGLSGFDLRLDELSHLETNWERGQVWEWGSNWDEEDAKEKIIIGYNLYWDNTLRGITKDERDMLNRRRKTSKSTATLPSRAPLELVSGTCNRIFCETRQGGYHGYRGRLFRR